MAAYFLDTNIFLRHLTGDDLEKSETCKRLFGEIAEGRTRAWTSDLAIAEVVFVLSSRGPNGYNYTREEIRRNLGDLLTMPGLELPGKRLYPRIFELYTKHRIDFIDAYHTALIEESGTNDVFSYDHDFDTLSDVIRLEP